MKKLLFLLLLVIEAVAQTPVPTNQPLKIFRGNVYESMPLAVAATDTTKLFTVRYTYDNRPTSVLISPQPTIKRAGTYLYLEFTQTTDLPPEGWYELRVGGQVRYMGSVVVNKTGSAGSVVTNPVPIPTGNGVTTKTYQLANAPPGLSIDHWGANRFVRGTFFREDDHQIDPLWRIRVVNDNTITLSGPSNETFSGRLILEFVPLTNN